MRKKLAPFLAVPTLAATALAGMLPAQALTAPVLGPAGKPGQYSEQNIAGQLFGDSSNYRIPALADLGDGIVLAAWDGRPFNAADSPNPNSIVMRRSTDYGQTWSDIYYIAQGQLAQPGIQKYGYSDPSFVVDSEAGKVFAFFVYSKDQGFQGGEYGNDIENDRNIIGAVVTESTDGGITWSEPRDITPIVKPGTSKTNPQPGDVKSTFATSGEGIQLKYGEHAGRLVQQFAGKVRTESGQEVIKAYSVYSDDHGQTWQRGDFVGSAMDENKTVELSDGRLLLNSRDSGNSGYRKVAISEDGGQTWGPVTLDTELPDPTNNASIFRMYPNAPQGSDEAKKLIFTNSNNNANHNRVNLSARVSCDNGETWPGLRQINPGFSAYSSGTALSNGKFGVLYEASYATDIRFGTFDEAWLNMVCAPLSAQPVTVTAGQGVDVPVTITNQESTAISGRITLADTGYFSGGQTEEITLQPGETQTVNVRLDAATSARTGNVDAVFTAADGKQSRFTFRTTVEGTSAVFGAQIHSASAATRDVANQPYSVGEKIRYTFSVTSTSDETVAVVPTAGNLDTGFFITGTPNCRYSRLAAGTSYTCTTAEHTVTQEDIDRGYFVPTMSFSVTSVADSSRTVSMSHTGAPVKVRDVDLTPTLTVTGEATSQPKEEYVEGDLINYSFTVANTSPFTVISTPTAGNFERGFFTDGIPNCRWRNLAAGASYTCTSAQHTVTAEDLERGYFEPRATFTATSSLDGSEQEYEFVGERINLPVAPAAEPTPAPSEEPAPELEPSEEPVVPTPEPEPSEEPEATDFVFTDVKPSHANYTAIQWAARNGIIQVSESGAYQPRANVKRGELASYLFRHEAPENYVAPRVSPFKDVPVSHKYYREIAWASERGLMPGSATGTFRPSSNAEREDLAIALFNLVGPSDYIAPAQSPYKDVLTRRSSYRAIAWLAEQGGDTGKTFRPNAPLKRDAAAALLYASIR